MKLLTTALVLLASSAMFCDACKHAGSSMPRPLMTMMMRGQHHRANNVLQLASQSAVQHKIAAKDDPGTQCSNIREQQNCTAAQCVWCRNKYSPQAGSDGVCLDAEQAKQLPPYSYECTSSGPDQEGKQNNAAAAVAAAPDSGSSTSFASSQKSDASYTNSGGHSKSASGGDPSQDCAHLHFKKKCTQTGCIWCKNKFSMIPGSDGVCISEEHAWELPKWTYECEQVKPHKQQMEAAAGGAGAAAAAAAQQQPDAPAETAAAAATAATARGDNAASSSSERHSVTSRLKGPEPSKDCATVREKAQCMHAGCIWCTNKYSPQAGSDGVCVDEGQASYLPKYSYKCEEKKKPHATAAAAVVVAA